MLAMANASVAAGYLAVGFGNKAGAMVPASVAAAVGGTVEDYRLTGKGDPNTGPGMMNLTAVSVQTVDGTVVLRFTRPLISNSSEVEAITEGKKTNVIVAVKKAASWGYHDDAGVAALSMISGGAAPKPGHQPNKCVAEFGGERLQ